MIYAAWLVWAVPIIAVPFVPLIGAFNEKARNWFAVSVGALTFLIAIYLAATFSKGTETSRVWIPVFSIPVQILVDPTSVLLSAFISFLSFLIILYSVGYMKGEKGQSRYYSLVLLFIGGMLGIVMAGNLIQLYFFWEIVGICSAFLIAFWFDKPEARKAGIKAFVVTRFGDIALFLAVLFLLFTIGNGTQFSSIFSAVGTKSLQGNTLLLVGILLLIGAMGKSAQVPLHVWLPDAMEGPTPVSALIHAATMVNAGVYLLIRMYPLFSSSTTLLILITVVGLTSMIFGAACALVSEDLKRVLAYSTISQLGLMFAAIGVGTSIGATFHLISQGLFKALAFLAAGSVITATGTRNIEEMGGLRKSMKFTYIGFLFAILAMSGIPPFIGFFSKDWIVSAALTTNLTAAILIILSTVLTALYGFRVLFKVFYGNSKLPKEPTESPPVMTIPIVVLAISVLVGWVVLYYQPVLSLTAMINIGVLSSGLSLVAIACGIGITYLAFVSQKDKVQTYLRNNVALSSLRNSLLEGLNFDRFYGFLYSRIVLPLAKVSSYLETGWLGVNVALMLGSFLVVIFLIALRVI